jgi:hypothetical protein
MIGSAWSYAPYGYYKSSDFGRALYSSGRADFQTQCTIGLSGKPWAPLNPGMNQTQLKVGETVPDAAALPGLSSTQSWCEISGDGLFVRISERSSGTQRRVTKATLAQLKGEFDPLAKSPTWETIQACLPPDSIRRGAPSFELRSYFQPGIYTTDIWLNPGESGMIYLKAFEVTKGTRLSDDSLKSSSNEWIGWSDDPAELFFSNTNFTIYKGDRGKPYAARFEVWFVPDSGGKERKLMEKVFKIEGWER